LVSLAVELPSFAIKTIVAVRKKGSARRELGCLLHQCGWLVSNGAVHCRGLPNVPASEFVEKGTTQKSTPSIQV
jgi:hypothetical protein